MLGTRGRGLPGAVMARYDGEDEHDVKVRDGCVLGAALLVAWLAAAAYTTASVSVTCECGRWETGTGAEVVY